MVKSTAAGQSPEHIYVYNQADDGFDGVIVLHSTALGPAAGGCRVWTYQDRVAMTADANRLADRGILYAPDFVVNAGGIINVAAEYLRWSPALAGERIEQTAARLAQVLALAQQHGTSTHAAAETLARKMIAAETTSQRSAA